MMKDGRNTLALTDWYRPLLLFLFAFSSMGVPSRLPAPPSFLLSLSFYIIDEDVDLLETGHVRYHIT